MRIKLSLIVHKIKNVLPINYPYLLSAWIYKTLYTANSEFSHWLHQQGYSYENKHFKLFTFADIFNYPPWKRKGDRLAIYSGRAELVLSFFIETAVENFIIGLFQNQRFEIGDRKSQACFEVQSVERLADPEFSPWMTFRTLSPLCLSRSDPDRKHAIYLHPGEAGYADYLFNNLLYKYLSTKEPGTAFEKLKARMEAQQPFSLEILDEPKSRLMRIKAGHPEETRVRGYHYRFRISAPPELLALGYHAGFGEKNSMGFGCVESIESSGG